MPTAAALGAIDIAVPAAATEQGHPAAAGRCEAAMAAGTVAGSLLAGWWAFGSPQRRVVAMQAVMAGGLAVSTLFATQLALLGAVLVVPGVALGALFASLYLLVGQLAPKGSGTRTFAWLVTVNNGGLALGAAVAGAWSEASGPVAGLWFATACALAGIGLALGAFEFVRAHTTWSPGLANAMSTFQQTARWRYSGERQRGGVMGHIRC